MLNSDTRRDAPNTTGDYDCRQPCREQRAVTVCHSETLAVNGNNMDGHRTFCRSLRRNVDLSWCVSSPTFATNTPPWCVHFRECWLGEHTAL